MPCPPLCMPGCEAGESHRKCARRFIPCARHAMSMCARLPRPPVRLVALIRDWDTDALPVAS